MELVKIKVKHGILFGILALLVSLLLSQAGIVNPPDEVSNESFITPYSIVIDGDLSPNEWDDAEHVIQWYMDADPENYDGFNYMYITEDIDNLYVAIDLVSDQTNDETGEWVGMWLNTNQTITNSDMNWHDSLNKGMESLLFDVENNQEMPFFQNTGSEVREYYGDIKSLCVFHPYFGSSF